jgi:AGCS family alanine or glycine:cation symporter
MALLEVINSIKTNIWGYLVLELMLFVGVYQTIRLRGIQFRYLFKAFKILISGGEKTETDTEIKAKDIKGDINSFQSLMTALAGSIGTGNITGIATAVMTGGFGALFWMWVMAAFGMATAYSETLLGVKYREVNSFGTMSGGPMYSLKNGLNSKFLAMLYALLAGIAIVGIGCLVQSNSMVDAMASAFDVSRTMYGIVIAIAVGAVLIGGVKSIGRVAGYLVPFMAVLYIGAAIIVLIDNFDQIPKAFTLIFSSAFTGQAAVGGFLGSTIALTLQNGVQFGAFANESGLGSLAIAGANAQVKSPAQQGMMSLCGVFLSTMVVCTLTGLVLAVSNVQGTVVNGETLVGSPLAMAAFSNTYDGFKYLVMIVLNLFAFTTMLAWGYYGEKCFEYLLGSRIVMPYRWSFTFLVVIGAILELDLVWAIAGVATAAMALPNLISVIRLSKVVKEETDKYLETL